MNARYETPKADSIFETSLADAFMYLWLAAHSLGLAAQPVSAVKNARVQGPLKRLLNLPDFIYVYEMLAVGKSALQVPPPPSSCDTSRRWCTTTAPGTTSSWKTTI